VFVVGPLSGTAAGGEEQDAMTAETTAYWHPKIRAVHEYWHSIHPGDGRLPGRAALDPLAIAPILPHVMLIDVDGRPPRFRYRLIGTRMVDALGGDFTGQWLDEAHLKPGSPAPQFPSYIAVAVTGQPEWRRGPPHFASYIDRCKELERLFLPLAADGRTVDMILTTTLFFDPAGREI
jgi:hypothetical protein